MRVPDEIRKSVLFIGIKGDMPEYEWRGTGYLISSEDSQVLFKRTEEYKGIEVESVGSMPFMFLATARHVAEALEGKEFALRINTKNGAHTTIEGHADQKWWYHPTEKKYVDAAVTTFFPPSLRELDIFWVELKDFADEEIIRNAELGVGDEVFIAGLFTEVQETTQNVPIVRIGNLAMMPGEKIPFKDGKLIDAYLVESRSIGGLSGSPVFVRQTIKMKGYTASKMFVNSKSEELPNNEVVYLSGLGRTYFLGSMIGHWDAPTGFHFPKQETVNMGISPMVPAHKIKEILQQPELLEEVKRMGRELKAKKHKGAVEDFALPKQKTEEFSKEDFEAALKKASRKIEPEKP